jgi:hypothetical protein
VAFSYDEMPVIETWYFVTARHLADDLGNRSARIIVGRKDRQGIIPVPKTDNNWYTHPDKSVDVAVLPLSPLSVTWDLDIKALPVRGFLDRDGLESKQIGIGDEVFMPGLFTFAPGSKRILPILRHGNIAMLPDDHIQVDSGFSEVYLIEARSMGGISGSPVFARRTVGIQTNDAQGDAGSIMCGVSGEYYLIGLAHGHWDIRESEINKAVFTHNRQRGVNLGIAVVVPAHKILEVLNHPDLVAIRDLQRRVIRRVISPGPDQAQ